MDDETRTQLSALQQSVDAIGAECHTIAREQERSAESHKQLHREHNKLVERIESHERKLSVHLNDYQRQQEHNELIHAHMTGATLELKEELKDFRGEFVSHAHSEEEDRKHALAAQKKVTSSLQTTIVTVLLSGGGIFLTMLGLLLTLWLQA